MEGKTLISQSEYARRAGVTRGTVNYYVRKEQLETEIVGGVPYIFVPEDGPLPKPSKKAK